MVKEVNFKRFLGLQLGHNQTFCRQMYAPIRDPLSFLSASLDIRIRYNYKTSIICIIMSFCSDSSVPRQLVHTVQAWRVFGEMSCGGHELGAREPDGSRRQLQEVHRQSHARGFQVCSVDKKSASSLEIIIQAKGLNCNLIFNICQ